MIVVWWGGMCPPPARLRAAHRAVVRKDYEYIMFLCGFFVGMLFI
jgi:hypothetical protein